MIRDRVRRFRERERQNKIKGIKWSDQRLIKEAGKNLKRRGWLERRRRLMCVQKIKEDPS